jgi:hypothetical protein
MTYRFACRHCGSRFSLEQQLREHEEACAKVDIGQTERTTEKPGQVRRCKYCPESFTNFGLYGTHRWKAHRAEVLADLKKSRARRKADEGKIDAAIRQQDLPKLSQAPAPSTRSTTRRPVENGHLCPTCGGHMPEKAAELLNELKESGFSDPDALEALRIARRVLGPGASA